MFIHFRYLLFIFLLATGIVNAKSHIQHVNINKKNGMLFANVSTFIDLKENAKEAINSGVTLKFKYQFELKQIAWYKFSSIAEIEKNYYVYYERISEKFIVSNPVTLEKNVFTTLYAAKQFMENIQNFPLILSKLLPNKKLRLGVKFKLTNENLPAYVSVERYIKDDWDVDSNWYYKDMP